MRRLLVFAVIVMVMALIDGFVVASHTQPSADSAGTDGAVTLSLLAIAFMVFVVLEVLDPGTRPHIILWWASWAMASANIAVLIIALSPHARHIAQLVGAVVGLAVFAVGVSVLYPKEGSGPRDGA